MLQQLKHIFLKQTNITISCPVEGEAVSIKQVNDETFRDEILGTGIAIKPTKGRVVSPIDGTVTVLLESSHAVSLQSDSGVEILVHVGLDTIKLQGQYFKAHVKVGDQVKAGDLLLEFDPTAIQNSGYDTITPVVILNTNDFSNIEFVGDGFLKEQDDFMRLVK